MAVAKFLDGLPLLLSPKRPKRSSTRKPAASTQVAVTSLDEFYHLKVSG
jgi:hypothetical protein